MNNEAEVKKLRALLTRAADALIWCSAASDFDPEVGRARMGWKKLVPLLLDEISKETTDLDPKVNDCDGHNGLLKEALWWIEYSNHDLEEEELAELLTKMREAIGTV